MKTGMHFLNIKLLSFGNNPGHVFFGLIRDD